jgi:hypothetical protein
MKKNYRIGLISVALFIAAAACTIDLGMWKFWEKNGAEEPAPDLATFTPVPTSTPISEGENDPTPTYTVVVPTVTPVPTASGPSTTATGASCLPGVWQINHDSVTEYIYLTLIGVQQYGFSPQSSEGLLRLQISSGQIVLLAEDFTVGVGVNVGEIDNLSAFSASIDAEGFANYVATETQVALTDILYDADGTITSLSASFTVDFDDLLSLAQTLGFAEGIQNPVVSKVMTFRCSGDNLTVQVNPYSSVDFDRVVE